MKYQHMMKGIFMVRPNRFLAYVMIGNQEVVCHVKNTGRCRELLIPGVTVMVQYHPDAEQLGRKTKYSLIGVYKGDLLINMDSQAPNQVTMEWLKNGGFTKNTGLEIDHIRREVTYAKSRFDFAFEHNKKPAFMEVKGVTLEEEGIAKFPDAPTQRGVKHLLELGDAAKNGYEAYVLFVIQMKGMKAFIPNLETHPEFGRTLKQVEDEGVHILAFDCRVTEDELIIEDAIPVWLNEI